MQTQTIYDRIGRLVSSGDAVALAALYAPDALVDINVPQWRYQILGADVESVLREDLHAAGRRVTGSRITPFDSGVIVEEEVHFSEEGETRKFRQINVFRVQDNRIVEHTVYCTGIWDAATIARQAVEAPMVRR